MENCVEKRVNKIEQMKDIFLHLDQKFKYVRENIKFNSVGYDEKLASYQKDIYLITHTLKAISPNYSYIITQTFGSNGEIFNKWWKGIFPKTTFYRKREKAIHAFLKEYQRLCLKGNSLYC